MMRTITTLLTIAVMLFVVYFYYEIYLINKTILFANLFTVIGISLAVEVLSRSKNTTTRISDEDKLSVLSVIMAFTLALSFISVSTVSAV